MRARDLVRSTRAGAAVLAAAALGACAPATQGGGMTGPTMAAESGPDPRVGLRAGWLDAESAIRNLELIAHVDRPQGFYDPTNPGNSGFSNTDLAFQGNYAFVGNYNGFNIYDVSNPQNPRLTTTVVCPGGQGDLSVHNNLLFMSVEQTRGRLDCGPGGVQAPVSPERFRGVRIFDISNIQQPRQVAAVQTCRGSHTHTLVPDLNRQDRVFLYVSGTGVSRSGEELEGCADVRDPNDPRTSYWSIAVIEVPLAAPQQARVVSEPRVFADEAGNIAALYAGGESAPGAQRTSQTNQCHDITAYPAIGLAAGACSGNGILLDISDPANPRRIDEVFDPNFAYWHSATFSDDGSKVIFTDEWGGGGAARCLATDRPEWGANAIFTLNNRNLEFADYYKLPAAQTESENCVAHNGSLIPVPGRDIMVQAWYQGGLSIFDFTDPENPYEIAFFDRGPVSPTEILSGGYWSVYWYNGEIYGSEISRGLDVFRLRPSQYLSQNEIDAARLVRYETLNPQNQPRIVWPAAFVVSRAYLDQLERNQGLSASQIAAFRSALQAAEALNGAAQDAALTALAAEIEAAAGGSRDAERVRMLAQSVRALI